MLRDISFTVHEGEAVAIFGHNGAGKTTLLKCCVGDVDGMTGSVQLSRRARSSPGAVFLNVRRGIGLVPQGHNVFRHLSVRQNLSIAGLEHGGGALEQVYRLFPILRRTRAGRSLVRCRAGSSRSWRWAWR